MTSDLEAPFPPGPDACSHWVRRDSPGPDGRLVMHSALLPGLQSSLASMALAIRSMRPAVRAGAIPPLPRVVRATPTETLGMPRACRGVAGRPLSLAVSPPWDETTRWGLEGRLPPGLAFDAASGTVRGTPTSPCVVEGLVLRAFSASGRYARGEFAVEIA